VSKLLSQLHVKRFRTIISTNRSLKNIGIYRSGVKKIIFFSPRSNLVAHNSFFLDFLDNVKTATPLKKKLGVTLTSKKVTTRY
jgi:hypothetical protein